MKTFLKKLLLLLPLPLFAMWVNYKQDPANLFKGGRYEKQLANFLEKGENVTNLLNYDERNFQKIRVKALKNCPEILVLGSSKTLMIDQSMFQNENLYNGSLSAGCLEDMIGVYRLFDEKRCKLKKVILGIDPWLLNENNGLIRWKKMSRQYSAMLDKFGLKKKYPLESDYVDEKYKNYLEIGSFSYFQQSIVDWLRGVDTELKATQEKTNIMATKRPDGSYMYESSYRDRSPEKVKRNAETEIAETYIKGFQDFTQLSQKHKDIFEKFITYLQNKGIEVSLFIAPYHPVVYNFFKKQTYYQIVFTADQYFRDLAKRKGIKCIGNMNPEVYHLDNTDFYDGMHCNVQAITQMMKEIGQ